jgi:hypothetical protein
VAALLLEIDVGVAGIGRLQVVSAALAFDLGLLTLEGALFGGMGGALDIGFLHVCP